MSYYGYYGDDTNGDDTAAPTDSLVDTYYEEAYPVEMEEEDDEKAMGPVAMAFVLVPLVDFFVYYKINDFNTASNSEWTNAANACLAGGAIKLVGIAAYMAAGVAMPIAAISVVHEIAALYLINTADGKLTSSDVNMYYGGAAFGLVLSAAKAMMMGGSEDDEEVADDYYGEEDGEDYGAEESADVEEETTGGDASGYYGYY
jgi:hypothetical protein